MSPSNKDEYPRPGEFVIVTVKDIFKQGAFVTLDEYKNKKGMLPLSEISLKWVRNIRDYVKEGQKVVLLVLRVNPERGHIDLSLRRVTDAQRKEKLQEVKQRQRAEKLLEFLANELKVSIADVNKKIKDKLLERFDSLYEGLESITIDKSIADKLDIDEKWKSELIALVSKSIKPPLVNVTGYVKLRSYEPNGVDIVKDALKTIENYKTDYRIDVSYISAPIYRIKVTAGDYKMAEKVLRNSVDGCIEHIKKFGGEGEFHRTLKQEH